MKEKNTYTSLEWAEQRGGVAVVEAGYRQLSYLVC